MIIILLVSLMLFCLLWKRYYPSLGFKNPSFWILLFLVYTNLNFILSVSVFKVVHMAHVLSHYKVIRIRTLKNRKGYYLAYIGIDSKDRIVVVSIDKIKKKIKLDNPRLFLVNDSCIFTIIIDYLYSDNPKDLNWLKYQIYTAVNTEYYKLYEREWAMNELEKMGN